MDRMQMELGLTGGMGYLWNRLQTPESSTKLPAIVDSDKDGNFWQVALPCLEEWGFSLYFTVTCGLWRKGGPRNDFDSV